MKKALLLISILLTIPFSVFAAECSSDGYTVVYVNGIFTDTKEKANRDKDALKQSFFDRKSNINVAFTTGYNPSHLAGGGDLIQAITQAMGDPLSSFDLRTILNQIHSEVRTRKILLVGHSQGTFYTNQLYEYLTTHGVPTESIGVYNLATPASFVAGGGKYLTSSNDKLISEVRTWDMAVGFPEPLSPNITILQSADDITSQYGGHSLATVYLRGAPGRIVGDISNALSALKAEGGGTAECFTPPGEDIAYKTGKAVLAVADPVAIGARSGAVAIANGATFAGNFAGAFVGNAIAQVKAIAGFATNPTSILPPANMDTALQGLDVVHVVYGSSVTSKDAQDLLGGVVKNVAREPAPTQKPPVTKADIQNEPKTKGAVLGESIEVPQQTPPPLPEFPPVMIGAGGGASSPAPAPAPATPPTPSSATTTPSVATTTPLSTPTLSIDECDHSLSASFCLIPKTSLPLSWDAATSASAYAVFVNGALGVSVANTSATITLASNATSTIELVAFDSSGLSATSTPIDVFAYSNPIHINEIGWGGTLVAPTDQWVELENMTPYDIDLSAITLSSDSGSFSIPLSGTMAPVNFYLSPFNGFTTVARNISTTLAPVNFFSAPTLSLSTSGETLRLTYSDAASTTIDSTPLVATCSGWCAGSSTQETRFYDGLATVVEPVSMERLDTGTDGTLSASWASNDTYTSGSLTEQDSAGNVIRATLGFANSNHYPLYGWWCDPDTFPITNGQTYHPQGSPCHYLSGFVEDSTQRIGQIYKGDLGDATAYDWHVLPTGFVSNPAYGDHTEAVLFDPGTVLTPGDHFFTAIFARHVVQDIADFQTYFETSSTTGALPPHADYRVVQWVYGN